MRAVIDKILQCKSAAVLAHVNEDPDALGSGFAMSAMLRKMGKKAVFYISDEIESSLKFIGNEYKVYKDENDIEDHDLCICLDCGDINRLAERKNIFKKIKNSVNIDHHYTNPGFADVNYVDGKAAATAQILFKIFKEMSWELNDEIARYLYIALASDTGCFKYSNVSPETMHIAGDLLEYGFDHDEVCRLLFDTYTLDTMKLKAQVMADIHPYDNGRISLISISRESYEHFGLTDKDVSTFIDIPRSVKGAEIAVCLKQQRDGKIRVNLRSNGDANVAEIAAYFGGGGHIKAAGATISNKTLEEAEKCVVAECEKAISRI